MSKKTINNAADGVDDMFFLTVKDAGYLENKDQSDEK